MRTKRTILYIFVASVLSVSISSCTYDEQPEKTRGSNSSYVLPRGEIPSAEEIDIVSEVREEYKNATN